METGFNVQYSTDGVNWSTNVASVPAGNNAASLTGLSADTEYYVEVQAYGPNSSGARSAPVAVPHLKCQPAPLVYRGFDYPYISGSTTDMNWQNGGVG